MVCVKVHKPLRRIVGEWCFVCNVHVLIADHHSHCMLLLNVVNTSDPCLINNQLHPCLTRGRAMTAIQ